MYSWHILPNHLSTYEVINNHLKGITHVNKKGNKNTKNKKNNTWVGT